MMEESGESEAEIFLKLQNTSDTILTQVSTILAEPDQHAVDIRLKAIVEANCTRGRLVNPGWDTFINGSVAFVNDFFNELGGDLTTAVNRKSISPSQAAEIFSYGIAEILINGLHFNVVSVDKKVRKTNKYFKTPGSLQRDIRNQEQRLRKICNRKKRLQRRRIPQKLSKEDQNDLNNVRQLLNWLYRKRTSIIAQHEFYCNEREYRTDFWKFSKRVIEGKKLDQPCELSKNSTENYFKKTCSTTPTEVLNTDWWGKLEEPVASKPFDNTAIRPRDVEAALKGKNNRSSAGPDGIGYGILKRFSSIKHFLATIFNKILVCADPPRSWRISRTILIYKKDNAADASNYRPISLSSCIGKVFHSILNKRLLSFATYNGLINPVTQKGFMEAMNGCGQHSMKLQTTISNHRKTHKSLHIAWLDIANAYGSLRHDYMEMVLNRYKAPVSFVNYIMSYYRDLHTVIVTNTFRTDPIKINVGIFQGDTISCTLFLLAFNPILELLQTEAQHGAPIDPASPESRKTISLAFADDLTIVCRRQSTMQRLLNIVATCMRKVGFELKPAKCVTLSLSSGCTKGHDFLLDGKALSTVESSPFKFLGTTIFPQHQKRNAGNLLKEKLNDLLSRVDQANIRGAYKVQIYNRFVTQCMRFFVTVHETAQCIAIQLEQIATRYLKKWLGGKSLRAMNVDFLYHPEGLGLKSMDQIYRESRASLIADCNTSNDAAAKEAASLSEPELAAEIATCIQDENDQANMKAAVINRLRDRIGKEILETRNNNLVELVQQNQWKKILDESKADSHFIAAIMNLPPHLAKFLVMNLLNIAPCSTNLVKWGKTMDASCKLCNQPFCTTSHILAGCQFALKQHRFTWRHDSLLQCIYIFIKKMLGRSELELRVDLPTKSYECSDSVQTIPDDIAVVSKRPDISVVDRRNKKLMIVELTAPFDMNLHEWEKTKEAKYRQTLIPAIEESGWKVEFAHLGVGALGTIPRSTKDSFFSIAKFARLIVTPSPTEIRSLCLTLSKIAISSSYVIFRERNNPHFVTPGPDNLLKI